MLFRQLREISAFLPPLPVAIGELIAGGFLPPAFADHQALLGRLLVAARLLAPDLAEPPELAQAVLAQACGQTDYPTLLRALADARHGVAATWADLFGVRLEIA